MDDGRVAATLAPPAGGTRVAEPPESPTRAADARGRRIAYLSFSSGEFDARTFRMARSAIAAGYHVTVYCRWHEGLPPTEDGDGYRLIRVPWDWQLAIPILRRGAMDRARTAMAATVASARDGTPDDREDTDTDPDAGGLDGDDDAATSDATGGGPVQRVLRLPISLARRVVRRLIRPARRWWRLAKTFPLRPLGWAWALESVAEPADIWHGMWAGSLPALDRLRRKHGGRTIYDSRDVYMHSRDFAKTGPPLRDILAWFERRWARSANAVLTVNDAYADLLAEQLLVPRPPVVMNCPEAWVPPVPAPDLIREALGLGTDTKVALYQGHLMSDRGIEQAMEAILEVPGTVLALLGFGTWQDRLTEETAAASVRRPGPSAAARAAGGAPAVDGVGRRHGHGHPADDRQPSLHDAPEAVREHRRRRAGRRLGPAGYGRHRPLDGGRPDLSTRPRRRPSRPPSTSSSTSTPPTDAPCAHTSWAWPTRATTGKPSSRPCSTCTRR